MRLDRKIVPFEIKAEAAGDGMLAGYAACTKNIDSYGHIIAPGAFDQDLASFLRDGFLGGLNHNWDEPIGKPTEAREDAKGLYIAGSLLDTPHAQFCRKIVNDKVCKKLSIGYQTLGRMYCETQDDVKRWWDANGYAPSAAEVDAAKYGALILTRVKLYETSPVMIPANGSCDITDSKSARGKAAPGRLSLDDEFLAAHGTVEDFLGRLESYCGRKAASERPVPPSRRAQVKRLLDRLAALDAAMARTPEAKADDAARACLSRQAEALALDLELIDLAD